MFKIFNTVNMAISFKKVKMVTVRIDLLHNFLPFIFIDWKLEVDL